MSIEAIIFLANPMVGSSPHSSRHCPTGNHLRRAGDTVRATNLRANPNAGSSPHSSRQDDHDTQSPLAGDTVRATKQNPVSTLSPSPSRHSLPEIHTRLAGVTLCHS